MSRIFEKNAKICRIYLKKGAFTFTMGPIRRMFPRQNCFTMWFTCHKQHPPVYGGIQGGDGKVGTPAGGGRH